jgi:hypothetical protein
VEKKYITISLCFILAVLGVSTWAALFPEEWAALFPENSRPSFWIARLFLLTAVFSVAGLIGGLLFYYPKVEKQQKPKG